MLFKRILAITVCLFLWNNSYSMQQSRVQLPLFLANLQSSFNVVYKNYVFQVSYQHFNLLGHSFSNYRVIPLGKVSPEFSTVSLPGHPFVPTGQIKIVRNACIMPNGVTRLVQTPVANLIPATINTSCVQNRGLSFQQNVAFMRGGLCQTMDLIHEIQAQKDRELAPEIMKVAMFPSTAMRTRFEKEAHIANQAIKDGFRACSSWVLENCIQRLGNSLDLMEKYYDQAIKDYNHHEALRRQAMGCNQDSSCAQHDTPSGIPLSYTESDKVYILTAEESEAIRDTKQTLCYRSEEAKHIAELEAQRDEYRHLFGQLKQRPDEIRVQQEANAAALVEHSKNLTYSEVCVAHSEIYNSLLEKKEALRHYKQFDQGERSTFFKVDALEAEIIQCELMKAALLQVLSDDQANIEQLSKSNDLLPKMVTLELIENEIDCDKAARISIIPLCKLRYPLAKSLRNQVYGQAYKEQLRGLQGNTGIINNSQRSEALAKTLAFFEAPDAENSCTMSRYNMPPELVVYLNEHQIEPSAFHIMIADPLRVQMFRENIILLQRIHQKYPFNEAYDSGLQEKLDAFALSTHNSITAIHHGDIAQASSCIDRSREIATEILRYEIPKSQPVVQQQDSCLIMGQDSTAKSDAQIPVQHDFVTTSNLKTEQQAPVIHDLAVTAIEAIRPAIERGLNALHVAKNTAAGFMENWRQAVIEDILQDKTDLEIAQALFGTESIAQAIEQNEHLYKACVQPYLDATKQSLDTFMKLPWQEKYRIVIGNIFEQATTAVAFHAAGRFIPIVREKLPELAQFISKEKPLTVAQTPEGIRVVLEVTPEFGSTPGTVALMEAEKTVQGGAKVPQAAEVAQKVESAESVQSGVAQSEQVVAGIDQGAEVMHKIPSQELELICKDVNIDEKRLKHLFRRSVGHFPEDTLASRSLF